MGTDRTDKSWHGIRQSVFAGQADPDAAPIPVKLPVAWGQEAADALAAMFDGADEIDIAERAEAWIAPVAAPRRHSGISDTMAADLHRMLALRRAAPTAGIWQGKAVAEPGFILNPGGFLDEAGIFDAAAFGQAVQLAVTALTLSAPSAHRLSIGFTDLNYFLSRLGWIMTPRRRAIWRRCWRR